MHMDYCLDKARRLTHNNEYRLVYKHGKYEVGRMYCTLSYARGEAIYAHWFCNRQKVGCAVERKPS